MISGEITTSVGTCGLRFIGCFHHGTTPPARLRGVAKVHHGGSVKR
jgi:hypothetical protein